MHLKCIAFDCFGTLFDMSQIPKHEIGNYVRHVTSHRFIPYVFPESWNSLQAFPDVAPGFEKLQSMGLKCVALSNADKHLIHGVARRSGFVWDHIVDLTEHRVYKPNVAAYRTVEADTGIAPEHCLMVTANPMFGDIEGSRAVGMSSQVVRHGYPNTILELADMLTTPVTPLKDDAS